MKRIFTFLFALFAVLGTWAESSPVLPTFSTDGAETWYSVEFKHGGSRLLDKGAGEKMLTGGINYAVADLNASWKLEGNQNSFYLKSASGNYVVYNTTEERYKTVATKTDATALKLYNKPGSDAWEIQLASDASKSMNQNGGNGVGKDLANYTAGSDGNMLYFNVPVSMTKLPKMSDEKVTYWYSLSFKNSMACTIEDKGDSQKILVSKRNSNLPSQVWKFIGQPDNFKMLSGKGLYIKKDGSRYVTTSDVNNAASFRFVSKVDGFFELQRTTETGNAMNPNSGIGIGNQMADFNLGDGNNVMTSELVTESGLPIFSTVDNPVYHNIAFQRVAKCNMSDAGAEQLMVIANADQNRLDDAQLWAFEGDRDNFKLKSAKGNYAAWNGSDRYKTVADASKASSFRLVEMNGDFSWEIQRIGGDAKNSMNAAGNVEVGKNIGEWGLNDPNNAMFFQVMDLSGVPAITASNDPYWYAVEFNSGNCLVGKVTRGKATTAKWNANDEGMYWVLTGTKDKFTMKNYLGDYLSYNGSVFETTNEVAKASTFKLAMNADMTLEIQKDGQGLNQVGHINEGQDLGLWTAGDGNNKLHFVFKQLPDFLFTMEGGKVHWWMINFNATRGNLASNGVNQNITNKTLDKNTNSQLWKLVGTQSKFQLVNKDGKYAVIGSDKYLKLSDTKDVNGFALDGDQIKYLGEGRSGAEDKAKVYLNLDGGAAIGKSISLWSKDDGSNKVSFLNPETFVMPLPVEGIASYTPAHPLTLWYKQPATSVQCANNWMEYSLPLGNGQLGASIFGGVAKDEILFNEKTVWTGSTSSYGHYQYFGSIFAEDKSGLQSVKNYVRSLDLSTATASVAYTDAEGTTNYTRDYFVSKPNNAIVARYKAEGTRKLTLRFTMKSGRPGVYANTIYAGNAATFKGKFETLSYYANMKVVNKGGQLTTTDNYIDVDGADEIYVVMSGGTDYDPTQKSYTSKTSQLPSRIEGFVNEAATILAEKDGNGWNVLHNAHLADYQPLFSNCELNLTGAKNDRPTNQMVDDYAETEDKTTPMCLMLEQLYFSYGRYLEIASSRGVDLPSNLQGIWNNNSYPAWHGDIHANINVQMNYWPAESANMSEMHMPFLNYIITMAESDNWKANARESGQTKGWTCYTENNIFGSNGGFAKNYVIANAWYCSHLWQHYRYTLDQKFLKRAFPAMWSATEYWIERIKYNAKDGTYECPNEYSPEHGPSQDAVAHAQQIVWELFDNTKTAIEILGADALGIKAADVATLNDRWAKMDKGLGTETYKPGVYGPEGHTYEWENNRNGVMEGDTILREWKYSPFSVSSDKGHRHMSHLMCVYPYNQVSKESPYFKPAVNSMKLRGDISTGWSMGWKVNLWARMLNGDRAHKIISNALRHSTAYGTNAGAGGVYYNLFDSHSPFQIDGNFGTCAGVVEMLMQSHREIIDILPALPKAWQSGSIKGLKAVGNFEVSIDWAEGKATKATIKSIMGQPMIVSYPGIANAQVLVDELEVEAKVIDANTIQIPAEINQTATINFNEVKAQGSFEIKTKEGFGTYYAEHAFTMPKGVKGSTVSGVTEGSNGIGTLNTNWKYTEGVNVPAKTALLLKGTKGKHVYNVVKDAVAADTEVNLLKGSAVAGMTENAENTYYYKLTYSMEGEPAVKTLGFFWGAENGGAFMTGANKAYLAVPRTVVAQVRGFRLTDEVTGIEDTVVAEEGETAIYNLAGVRMNVELNQLPKGVYIVNGKKVIIK